MEEKRGFVSILLLVPIVVIIGAVIVWVLLNNSSKNEGETGTIKIGFNADQTTPGTGPAGVSARWAFEIAVDEINAQGGLLGKKIETIILDDKADKEISKKNVEKLVFEDKVLAIVGPANSGNALYWLDIPQNNKTIVISPIATASQITVQFQDRPKNYIFKLTLPTLEEARLFVPWVLNKTNNGKVAILHDNGGYGVQGEKDTSTVLERWGKTPVYIKEYPLGSSVNELVPIVKEAKAAGADALVLYAYADSNANVLKALEKVPDYNPILVSGVASEVPTLWENAGELATKLVFPAEATVDLNDKISGLDKKIREKYGQSPFTWNVAAGSYDTVQLLAAAIEKADTTDNEAVRDALEEIKGVQGVIKLYDDPFSKQNHEAISVNDLYLAHWKDGKVVRLNDDVSKLEIR